MTAFNNKNLYSMWLVSLLSIRHSSASVCYVFPSWCADKACDQTLPSPGVIIGTGVTDGFWTTATVDLGGNKIELALRGKLRHDPNTTPANNPTNTFKSNGDGTYTFNARQVPSQALGVGEWSVEWSINTHVGCSTACKTLNDYTYLYEQDIDPTYETDFEPVYGVGDIINGPNPNAGDLVVWDHNQGTAAGEDPLSIAGTINTVPIYASAIDRNTVAQNSWKAVWTPPLMTYNPQQIGLYDFRLSVFDGWTKLATVQIQIIVQNMAYVSFPPDTAAECLQDSFMPWIFEEKSACLKWVNSLGTCQAIRNS